MITSLYLLWTKFRSWNNRRLTIRKLSVLNDHLLKDIGLERSDIHRVANELAASTATEADRTEKADDGQTILATPIPLPGCHR